MLHTDMQENWRERAVRYYDECSKINPKLHTLYDVEHESPEIPKFKDFQLFAICFPNRPPKKTRKVDYSASFFIIDPTINYQITLNAFRANILDFPDLDARGAFTYINNTRRCRITQSDGQEV
jgi:hypothetical protein